MITLTPFLATALLLVAPGPTNLLLAAAGARSGFRRALPLLGAALLAYVLVLAVLDWLLIGWARGPGRPALQLAAALLLAMMGLRLWRAGTDPGPVPVGRAAMFVVTVFNPKAPLIALLLLTDIPLGLALLGFAPLFLLAGGAYLRLGAWALPRLGRPVLVQRAIAMLLWLFAAITAGAAWGWR